MIFDDTDKVTMAIANNELSRLNRFWLDCILDDLTTLDDPYYMDIPADTYRAASND